MKSLAQQSVAKIKSMSIGQRMAIAIGIVVLVVGGSFAWSKVNQPTWAVLYGNLDDAQASTVLAKLDLKGVQHKLDGNGTRILVPKDQLAKVRLDLAAQGVSGQTVPAGWSILDGEGLATSDMRQKIDYQRALEGELARTLMAMDAVSAATVHLTLPDKPLYAGSSSDTQAQPTASVLLGLKRALTEDETTTVANLVASSVEGLTVKNVTVASTDGSILHAPGDAGAAGGSSQAFKATRDYEAAVSADLTALARQLTQRTDASVVVRAQLDYNAQTVETETVDPTKQVPTAKHDYTETWNGTGAATSGGTVGVDGGPLPTTVGGSGNGAYAKEEHTTTYEGGKTVTKTTQTPGKVTHLSVAVVVPFDDAAGAPPLDAASIAKVIGAAAGLDATRGDTIEVATVPATLTTPTTAAAPAATTPVASPLSVPVVAGGAAGAVFIIMLLFGRMRRRKVVKRIPAGADRSEERELAKHATTAGVPSSIQVKPMEEARVEAEAIRNDLTRLANETPESLAALLSTWLAKN
jgi:flagellar M-ring protein FliF